MSEKCYTCPDNISWSTAVKGSGDEDYIVSYEHVRGWSCTCPGMTYGKTNQCKHVKRVKRLRCTWNAAALRGNPGLPATGGKCPQCGKKVVEVSG